MNAIPKPVLLLILDGWGHREEASWNAIAQARCPNWRDLCARFPRTLVDTHGLQVGLPDGQMGNSEVGHMNIGAGRVVYQDLTRIDQALRDGTFVSNPALLSACAAASTRGRTLHVMGLLSPGGVHSHEEHVLAMLRLAASRGVRHIAVHAFLDGRDTPPRSAAASLEKLSAQLRAIRVQWEGMHPASGDDPPSARVATVAGRYYAMDRDRRWERVDPAYHALACGESAWRAPDALAALQAAYARGEGDEFVQPTVLDGYTGMRDGDAAVFMNFRADRARQMSQALTATGFTAFERRCHPALSAYVTLAEYATDLAVTAIAYPPQNLSNTLGAYLASLGKRQLRIAETEKYAHVTFFFNGGQEQAFPGEDRILVPSPKVATYDLQPQMSLPELVTQLTAAVRSQQYDLIVCNVANADMVGHTGVFEAALQAAEAVDAALGAIIPAVQAVGGEVLITADHGNLEHMRDEGDQPHTQHTVGPVPLVYVGRPARLRAGGALQDIAPTVLELMRLPQPAEMTGRSLLDWS